MKVSVWMLKFSTGSLISMIYLILYLLMNLGYYRKKSAICYCDVFAGQNKQFINLFKCPLLSDILSFCSNIWRFMAFRVIIIVIELMFLGINMFLALFRAHFDPRYAWLKWIWVGPNLTYFWVGPKIYFGVGPKTYFWVGPNYYLCPRTSTLLLYQQ